MKGKVSERKDDKYKNLLIFLSSFFQPEEKEVVKFP